MLAKITTLTCLVFSALYPLCFWISAKDPLKEGFSKFHIGLPNFVLGVTVISLLNFPIPDYIKQNLLIWLVALIIFSYFSWKKDTPNPFLISLPTVFGLFSFIQLQNFWVGYSLEAVLLSILSGLILTVAIFAMNLGHWYLNVHGLPISHIRKSLYLFWGFVSLRALWDIFVLITRKVLSDGDMLPMYLFMNRMDGFLLYIGLLFGTIFPLVALYFVKGTLDVKNTQSATGILYVILSAILIGDLTFKYYLIKFHIIL